MQYYFPSHTNLRRTNTKERDLQRTDFLRFALYGGSEVCYELSGYLWLVMPGMGNIGLVSFCMSALLYCRCFPPFWHFF